MVKKTNKNVKNPSELRIAGTDYDRRRVVKKAMKEKMEKMLKAGKSYTSVADTFGVSEWAVKYNTNKKFHNSEIIRKTENPTGGNVETTQAERNAYKESLLKKNKNVEVWVK